MKHTAVIEDATKDQRKMQTVYTHGNEVRIK